MMRLIARIARIAALWGWVQSRNDAMTVAMIDGFGLAGSP
jgi:hypothetical protein